MPDEAPVSLLEASERFKRFLQQNGYPTDVLWVGRNDLVWGRGRLWIRDLPMNTRWEYASKKYAQGLSRGLGVCLDAFGSTRNETIAAIFVPEDDGEAQRSLMPLGGLKMRASIRHTSAIRVTSALMWAVLSRWYRKSSRLFFETIEI